MSAVDAVSVAAAGIWTREAIADVLNRCPMVVWDRYTEGQVEGYQLVTVYGWIARDDGRSDFVELQFPAWSDEPGLSTSSAKYDTELYRCVFQRDGSPAQPCIRVEDGFGDLVERKVVLG